MPRGLVILSDLHFARGGARVTAAGLEPIVREASTLVLNGDVAEMHQPGLVNHAFDQVETLRATCARYGTDLVILAGNHDPLLSDARVLTLADGRVAVTHGDAFHPAIAPWARESADMRSAWRDALDAQNACDETLLDHDLAARLRAVDAASRAEWSSPTIKPRHSTIRSLLTRPVDVARILRYWAAFPSLANDFADRYLPTSEWLITGHSHRQGIWRPSSRTIVNTGAFAFPARPWAVRASDEHLEVRRLARVRGGERAWRLHDGPPLLSARIPGASEIHELIGLDEAPGDAIHATDVDATAGRRESSDNAVGAAQPGDATRARRSITIRSGRDSPTIKA